MSSKHLYSAPASELQFYADLAGLPDSISEINGVEIFKLRYNTVDVFGNPTIASWDSSGIYFQNGSPGMIPDKYCDFMQDSILDNIKTLSDHPVNMA